MKKTGLGRGLDALIDTSHVDTNGGSSISEIEINAIVANPDQPRRSFDEEALQELADSIREHGVISPITLRDNGDGTYSIEINLADTDLAANMDVEHLLFTGSGHTVLKLYFLE